MKKLPLTDEQNYIFDANEKTKGISYNISFEIRFSRHFPTDRLRSAVEKCLLSADISGARCLVDGDQKYMVFLPPTAPNIEAYHFPSAEQYQEFCDSVPEEKINNTDQLFHVFIYSIGDSFNNLRFCFNHLIFDGISGIILYEKVQKSLLDEHSEIRWHPFSPYLEKIDRHKAGEDYVADQTFWETQFSELSTCEHVFKDVIEIEAADASGLDFQLGKEFKTELLHYCNQKGTSSYVVIASAFAELVAKKFGHKRFSMEIPIGNRSGKEKIESLGAYEASVPFVFDFNRHPTLDQIINSTQKQSKQLYRHRHFDWNNKIFSAPYIEKYGQCAPQILFSYFCFNKNSSLGFSTVHHTHSNTCNFPINLYISDYLAHEKMNFYYVFWGQHIPPATIIELQNELEANLIKISQSK